MPQRIQRRRVKGWRLPPNTICVGRGGKWGNPHKITDYVGTDNERRSASIKHWLYDLDRGALSYNRDDIVRELRGKNIACWCPIGSPCHGDALLAIANRGT